MLGYPRRISTVNLEFRTAIEVFFGIGFKSKEFVLTFNDQYPSINKLGNINMPIDPVRLNFVWFYLHL